MSFLIRNRSIAFRIRDAGQKTDENFGTAHLGQPMLEWGSITKTVTARIAERLDEAGNLDLSAPVSDYLPTAKLPRSVDVRSLVTHTSGLPQLPADMFDSVTALRDPYAKYTTGYFDEQVLPSLAEQHTGTVGEFVYSNLGYGVLTRLLEVATGQDWWSLAKSEVFDPHGLTDITVAPPADRVPVLRTWAGTARKQWRDSGPFIGAGGIHSTFDALEQYARATAQNCCETPPFGWMSSPSLWWHNGHNRDHGSFVGVSHDHSRVLTVHTLGYRAGRADHIASRLESRYPAT